MAPIVFDNAYARLPDIFYHRQNPEPVKAPKLIRLNEPLAALLGFDIGDLQSVQGLAFLSGNRVLEGSAPLAMVYAGHQFGHFVPQLGDGRANLLGEIIAQDGVRRDLQLKGAGPTPFSRMGDGRAALGPVLREYIVSEAMHALGVPTTRALAAVLTGEVVARERLIDGAILARVARSHVRVGTFQYFAARSNHEAVQQLADYVIARNYPDIGQGQERYPALLGAVLAAQADLVAHWLSLGFIHGVMNTDNMSIAGETIDYGPCAFMDVYDPQAVFSSVDQFSRYAYGNQPTIAHWNLVQLAQCLLPLFDEDGARAVAKAQAIIDVFPTAFERALRERFCRKLGLSRQEAGDLDLVQSLLSLMADQSLDFTLTFWGLADEVRPDKAPRMVKDPPPALNDWLAGWRQRLYREPRSPEEIMAGLRAANPLLIPRNHHLEQAIRAAEEEQDFSLFHRLAEALQTPFDPEWQDDILSRPPRDEERVLKTFCGT